MDIDTVRDALAAFPGTRIIEAGGDIYAIADPDGDYDQHPRHGWATVVTSDAHDAASDLDRPGVFRVNLGLPRDRFHELVDPGAEHDFTALDVLMPHPVYGRQYWVCVLNPNRVRPGVQLLIAEAHAHASRRRTGGSAGQGPALR